MQCRLDTPKPKLRYTATAQPKPFFPFIFMYAHRDRQEQMWVLLLSKKDQVMIESRPLPLVACFDGHAAVRTVRLSRAYWPFPPLLHLLATTSTWTGHHCYIYIYSNMKSRHFSYSYYTYFYLMLLSQYVC